jgi:DNA-binding NtrC family response regulator
MNILVIDDSAEILAVLELSLRLDGHAVRTACDCTTAMDQINQFRPSVILLDFKVPGLDVEFFIQSVKTAFPATRIVLMSGINNLAEQAKAFGLKLFVRKPFSIDDFYKLIPAELVG